MYVSFAGHHIHLSRRSTYYIVRNRRYPRVHYSTVQKYADVVKPEKKNAIFLKKGKTVIGR